MLAERSKNLLHRLLLVGQALVNCSTFEVKVDADARADERPESSSRLETRVAASPVSPLRE